MQAETVHLFVFEGMADWEPAFAIAGINSPQFQREPGRFAVATTGLSTEPVVTQGGVRILPDAAVDTLTPANCAMLILPGGQRWEQGENWAAVQKAAELLAAGVPVAAICAATLALARAGFLDNRLHTSNAPEYLKATRYRGYPLYRNIPAIADGNLITAAGTAPVEFAYQIFGTLQLYTEPVLDAWYALFKHGDKSKYHALASATTAV